MDIEDEDDWGIPEDADTFPESVADPEPSSHSHDFTESGTEDAPPGFQIRVAVRVRPTSIPVNNVTYPSNAPPTVCLHVGKTKRNFAFDYVFQHTDNQQSVYAAAAPLLQFALRGFNVAVLAYGQTGSGKTHTMLGTALTSCKSAIKLPDRATMEGTSGEEWGVIPRFIVDFWESLAETDDSIAMYRFGVTLLEVYQDEVFDLLVTDGPASPGVAGVKSPLTSRTPSQRKMSRPSLRVREDKEKGLLIPGLTVASVASAAQCLDRLVEGLNRRTMAATKLNDSSSRSHMIFQITVESVRGGIPPRKLAFVDLAGSERLKRTKSHGKLMQEGISINSGLLALGNVISALSDASNKRRLSTTHIPYRDSKLTRMLQDFLGGNAATLFIACIDPAPENMDESLQSLRYAQRARTIRNALQKTTSKEDIQVTNLKREVTVLKSELIRSQIGLPSLPDVFARLRRQDDPSVVNSLANINALCEHFVNRISEEDIMLVQSCSDSCGEFGAFVPSFFREDDVSTPRASVAATDVDSTTMMISAGNVILLSAKQLFGGKPLWEVLQKYMVTVPSISRRDVLSWLKHRHEAYQNDLIRMESIAMRKSRSQRLGSGSDASLSDVSTSNKSLVLGDFRAAQRQLDVMFDDKMKLISVAAAESEADDANEWVNASSVAMNGGGNHQANIAVQLICRYITDAGAIAGEMATARLRADYLERVRIHGETMAAVQSVYESLPSNATTTFNTLIRHLDGKWKTVRSPERTHFDAYLGEHSMPSLEMYVDLSESTTVQAVFSQLIERFTRTEVEKEVVKAELQAVEQASRELHREVCNCMKACSELSEKIILQPETGVSDDISYVAAMKDELHALRKLNEQLVARLEQKCDEKPVDFLVPAQDLDDGQHMPVYREMRTLWDQIGVSDEERNTQKDIIQNAGVYAQQRIVSQLRFTERELQAQKVALIAAIQQACTVLGRSVSDIPSVPLGLMCGILGDRFNELSTQIALHFTSVIAAVREGIELADTLNVDVTMVNHEYTGLSEGMRRGLRMLQCVPSEYLPTDISNRLGLRTAAMSGHREYSFTEMYLEARKASRTPVVDVVLDGLRRFDLFADFHCNLFANSLTAATVADVQVGIQQMRVIVHTRWQLCTTAVTCLAERKECVRMCAEMSKISTQTSLEKLLFVATDLQSWEPDDIESSSKSLSDVISLLHVELYAFFRGKPRSGQQLIMEAFPDGNALQHAVSVLNDSISTCTAEEDDDDKSAGREVLWYGGLSDVSLLQLLLLISHLCNSG